MAPIPPHKKANTVLPPWPGIAGRTESTVAASPVPGAAWRRSVSAWAPTEPEDRRMLIHTVLLLRNTLLDDKRGALEFNMFSCTSRCFDILKTLLAGERLILPGLLPKGNNLTKPAFPLQTNQCRLYAPPAALPESHTPSQYSPVLKHPRC